MEIKDAVRYMAFKARKSLRAISLGMGKSESLLFTTLYKNSDLKGATLTAVAEQCGYTLAFIPADHVPDDAIVID